MHYPRTAALALGRNHSSTSMKAFNQVAEALFSSRTALLESLRPIPPAMRQETMQDTIAPPTQATITSPTIPHLSITGNCQQLVIHNRSFLVLGGEVQNSQFSSASYMKPVWPKLKAANINTVFGAVTWEQIEPTEGGFVFDELDRVVYDAREEGLKLVLLWFGGFKNGLFCVRC